MNANLVVVLSHGPNPDVRSGYWIDYVDDGAPVKKEAGSLRECSNICRAYIERNGLGGGNWTGGNIERYGKVIANVSYNGRVWGQVPGMTPRLLWPEESESGTYVAYLGSQGFLMSATPSTESPLSDDEQLIAERIAGMRAYRKQQEAIHAVIARSLVDTDWQTLISSPDRGELAADLYRLWDAPARAEPVRELDLLDSPEFHAAIGAAMSAIYLPTSGDRCREIGALIVHAAIDHILGVHDGDGRGTGEDLTHAVRCAIPTGDAYYDHAELAHDVADFEARR